MAEWTGPKRTLNSIIPEGVPPVDAASDHLPPPSDAPGAISSPQIPGMTPDNPALPERPRGSLPVLSGNLRPISEYGTAQCLLHLFTAAPGSELEAADWEQGPVATEEQRKANPGLLTPGKPLPGYALGIGRAPAALATEVAEAIDATAPAPVLPPPPPAAPAPSAAAPPAERASLAAAREPAGSAAGDVPTGAVRGDGTATCPAGYPIKGNAQSMIYHTTASRSYDVTIPEFCFATPEAAAAAGFRAPQNS